MGVYSLNPDDLSDQIGLGDVVIIAWVLAGPEPETSCDCYEGSHVVRFGCEEGSPVEPETLPDAKIDEHAEGFPGLLTCRIANLMAESKQIIRGDVNREVSDRKVIFTEHSPKAPRACINGNGYLCPSAHVN